MRDLEIGMQFVAYCTPIALISLVLAMLLVGFAFIDILIFGTFTRAQNYIILEVGLVCYMFTCIHAMYYTAAKQIAREMVKEGA